MAPEPSGAQGGRAALDYSALPAVLPALPVVASSGFTEDGFLAAGFAVLPLFSTFASGIPSRLDSAAMLAASPVTASIAVTSF